MGSAHDESKHPSKRVQKYEDQQHVQAHAHRVSEYDPVVGFPCWVAMNSDPGIPTVI